MTDLRPNEPLEAAPLADAKRSLACCQAALRAAVHAKPALREKLGSAHAQLADVLHDLEEIK